MSTTVTAPDSPVVRTRVGSPGADVEAQKAAINELALAYNELLPQIPLWERYGNNPAPDIRITGWPADGDPVYQNGTYNDPFVIVLMLNGTLQPKAN